MIQNIHINEFACLYEGARDGYIIGAGSRVT
jgi:hypothetical protein